MGLCRNLARDVFVRIRKMLLDFICTKSKTNFLSSSLYCPTAEEITTHAELSKLSCPTNKKWNNFPGGTVNQWLKKIYTLSVFVEIHTQRAQSNSKWNINEPNPARIRKSLVQTVSFYDVKHFVSSTRYCCSYRRISNLHRECLHNFCFLEPEAEFKTRVLPPSQPCTCWFSCRSNRDDRHSNRDYSSA